MNIVQNCLGSYLARRVNEEFCGGHGVINVYVQSVGHALVICDILSSAHMQMTEGGCSNNIHDRTDESDHCERFPTTHTHHLLSTEVADLKTLSLRAHPWHTSVVLSGHGQEYK